MVSVGVCFGNLRSVFRKKETIVGKNGGLDYSRLLENAYMQ